MKATDKSISAFRLLGIVCGVITFLLIVQRSESFASAISSLHADIADLFLSKSGHFFTLAVLTLWFSTGVWIKLRKRRPSEGISAVIIDSLGIRDAFLCLLLLFSLLGCAGDYAPSTQVLTLFTGIVIAMILSGVDTLRRQTSGVSENNVNTIVVSVLVTVFLFLSVWKKAPGHHVFEYRNAVRWCGPFDNPNTFGIVMAIGLVLAVGGGLWAVLKMRSAAHSCVGALKTTRRRRLASPYIMVCLCAIGGVLTARALYYSYSRGAWVAACCGLVLLCASWLVFRWRSKMQTEPTIGPASLPFIFVVCVSVGLSAFWSLRNGEWRPVRRAFSSVTDIDFSSRHRVVAWEGTLQMMADKPLSGFHWNQPTATYENFYLPRRLTEGAAVVLNDYFNLGATLGIGALICFAGYIWLSFHRTFTDLKARNVEPNWLRVSCLAGATVSVVGFWFDGGLLSLGVAAPFWILLQSSYTERVPVARPLAQARGKTNHAIDRAFAALAFSSRFAWIALFAFISLSVFQIAFVGSAPMPGTVPMLVRHNEVRAAGRENEYVWLALRQTPNSFLECVWISEDNRFFEHNGFDWTEIRIAWEESQRTGQPPRGASTITQQCARSVFLWHGRSWIRKALEAYYTVLMEVMLPKKRILELYVNAIEFGNGVYGLEAAARHYYHKPAKDLTREEAAMLVAIMPKPREWDPLHPNERVLKRQKVILERSANVALPIRVDGATDGATDAEGSRVAS